MQKATNPDQQTNKQTRKEAKAISETSAIMSMSKELVKRNPNRTAKYAHINNTQRQTDTDNQPYANKQTNTKRS